MDATQILSSFLPLQRNRAAGHAQETGVGVDCRRIGGRWLRGAAVAFGNLALHALHQNYQLFRFMISLGLLAHFLKILRSIRDTVRHWGNSPQRMTLDK